MPHHGEEYYLKQKIKAHLATLHRSGKAMDDRAPPFVLMPVPGGFGGHHLDFFCCVLKPSKGVGVFLAIEAKAFGKQPTPRQKATMEAIIQAGGIAFFADSFDSYLLNMAVNGLIADPTPPVTIERAIGADAMKL